MRFLSQLSIAATSWQGFERLVSRLLIAEGMEYVALVGRSGDGGADVLAIKKGRRWLFQVKRTASQVGPEVLDRTIAATRSYQADIPVIVSRNGFTPAAMRQRAELAPQGINVQLWDARTLVGRAERLPPDPISATNAERYQLHNYQKQAVEGIVSAWLRMRQGNALVVLATGLGKTFVAAEAARRIAQNQGRIRFLAVAHTNEIVYQLERSFWPFLGPSQSTVIVNGVERPDWTDLSHFDAAFATRDTLAAAVSSGVDLPEFDLVIVDECHHLGADTYEMVLDALGAGREGGPFLVGLTATPWRPNGEGLDTRFDPPVVSIDLIQGLNDGFLTNVDYRMFTDNVDWEQLRTLKADKLTPRGMNRTLFINEWDEGVVRQTHSAWLELGERARGIVFCGTVEHAEIMASKINALGFTHARPIYSRSSKGVVMGPIERNRLLWDFADGKIGILCSVDVLNEGVDVPDVNLVVFQRVTHSRRIFVQQLGRGLRIAPHKTKVIVLDFVSDVRRFAAGLDLQRGLRRTEGPVRVNLRSAVTFLRANREDEEGATFLKEWLGDLQEVEDAGEDVSVLRFPPLDHIPSA